MQMHEGLPERQVYALRKGEADLLEIPALRKASAVVSPPATVARKMPWVTSSISECISPRVSEWLES